MPRIRHTPLGACFPGRRVPCPREEVREVSPWTEETHLDQVDYHNRRSVPLEKVVEVFRGSSKEGIHDADYSRRRQQ
jgi:hypothetical protein